MVKNKNIIIYFITVLLSITCFILIYGINVLNPLYNDWLLRGGDLTQHYIGWEFYRMSQWQFPLGLMDKISYPNNVSIIFTDSIPIFALIFKLISPVLPETFQYFGWWELLCFILQSVFAVKLLHYYTNNKIVSVIGSVFFVLAPVFIARVFLHTALSSHWLLLCAYYLALKYICAEEKILKTMLVWGILGLLCGSIHMYYIPMCGIIMVGFLLYKWIRDKKIVYPALVTLSFLISSVFMVIIFGGLSHDHQLDAGGLGQFSFNMNGFFNSMGWSRWLPPLSSYGEGSSDAFAYLGLGILILLPISLIFFIYQLKKKKITVDQKIIPYIFIVVMT